MKTVNSLVRELQQNGQDYEYYPTPLRLAGVIASHMQGKSIFEEELDYMYLKERRTSILDICAGDGRFLKEIKEQFMELNHRFPRNTVSLKALEKSKILRDLWSNDIIPSGSDIHLIKSPSAPVIFCNPPFSEYETIVSKILNESTYKSLYLLLPIGWRKNERINAIIKGKCLYPETIEKFDFKAESARPLRHKTTCELFYIKGKAYNKSFEETKKGQVLENIIDHFSEVSEQKDVNSSMPTAYTLTDIVTIHEESKSGLFKTFEGLARNNYKGASEIAGKSAKSWLHETMQNAYLELENNSWNLVLSKLSPLNGIIHKTTRELLVDDIKASTDFAEEPIQFYVKWLISNYQKIVDDQFISSYYLLMNPANSSRYKNNQQIFDKGNWSYNQKGKYKSFLIKKIITPIRNTTCYGKGIVGYEAELVLGEVLMGLLSGAGYTMLPTFFDYDHMLKHSEAVVRQSLKKGNEDIVNKETSHILQDYYDQIDNEGIAYGKAHPVIGVDKHKNAKVLMYVYVYKSNTIHFKLEREFALVINLKFGKLKGWINNQQDAEDAFYREYPKKDIIAAYKNQHLLSVEKPNIKLLA